MIIMQQQTAQQSPLVSFIIPCYNTDDAQLSQCLTSLTSAALAEIPHEIIVVDDGSEQLPAQTLEDFSRNITLLQRRHEGVSAARNAGLDTAKGEYVQFVDADDHINAALFVSLLQMIKEKKYDVLMYGKEYADGHDRTISIAETTGTAYMSRHNLHGAVWNYVFRRSLTSQQPLRFTHGVAYAEDEEFTALLMLRAKHVGVVDKWTPYYYRIHQQSTTSNHSTAALQQRFQDTIGVVQRLKHRMTTLQGEAHEAMQRRVAQLTMDYLYNVMTLTQDNKQVEDHVRQLKTAGLFPLPCKWYTRRYALFCLLSRCSQGRRLLAKQCIRHHNTQHTP